MLKKLKKGFTLTELIIVIVIIGILAAVLIPSISGYIKKAKISKGIQEAKQMNEILTAEAIYQDKEYFTPQEVRELIIEADFELKSQLEDYRFWYDASQNQIKFLSMDEAFGSVSAAGKSFSQDCIEALSSAHPEYRYLDTYNDELTNVVNTVTDLITKALEQNEVTNSATMDNATKNKVLDTMDKIILNASTALSKAKIKSISSSIKATITNYVATFDTYNTVYVDNNLMYNRAYFAASFDELKTIASKATNIYITSDSSGIASADIAHMVFDPEITLVPANGTTSFELEVIFTTGITIPGTVTAIKNSAFTNVSFVPSIIVSDLTIVDNNALSDYAKTALTTVSTNSNFVTLYLGTDFEISYEGVEGKLNDGKIATYKRAESDPNPIKLETIIYNGSELIYTDENSVEDNEKLLSKYLVPSVEFKNSKIDFSKITKFIIRRSLFNNVCTYTGILIDEDLNSYKIESFGYITDIDWNIEQHFMGRDETGTLKVGADEATVKVYLPAYVYNFTNFKGAKMEVTLLPQYIKTRGENTLTGTIDVYDGLAISDEPIVFYIEDGIYDSSIGMYVYEKTIENLSNYTLTVNGTEVHCNQLYINKISVYTGTVNSEDPTTNNINYLFVRYYK